jgi:CAAX protease family protein
MIVTAPHATAVLPQYSRKKTVGVWAAAALPMGLLSWVGAPLLADAIGGPNALTKALMLLITAGLVWQFVLVLILLAPERRSAAWPGWREALWLRAPKRRLAWLLVLPLGILFAAEELIPAISHASGRDLGLFLESPAGEAFFSGAWGWYALVVVMVVFNTVLGEELLFRGLLLPRMNGAFGDKDWVANGVLFATYHLHIPWVVPAVLIDTLALSWPAKRFRSSLLPIAIHSLQSVVILIAVGVLVTSS